MRTLLIVLYLFIFSIISIPLYLVAFIIYKCNPKLSHAFAQRVVVIAFKSILWLAGTRYEVIGLENIPKDKGVLYVANHRSYFDIVITYATVPNLTSFISKKEIRKIPCISQWMFFLNCMFLDRDDLREGLKVILSGIERIKAGGSIFIAPEGTRNQSDELLPFKEGSLKMAQKTGCPVIPISITNAENVFESHVPWIRRAHVIVEYGKPIDISTLEHDDKKFLGAYVRNIIMEMYKKNKANI